MNKRILHKINEIVKLSIFDFVVEPFLDLCVGIHRFHFDAALFYNSKCIAFVETLGVINSNRISTKIDVLSKFMMSSDVNYIIFTDGNKAFLYDIKNRNQLENKPINYIVEYLTRLFKYEKINRNEVDKLSSTIFDLATKHNLKIQREQIKSIFKNATSNSNNEISLGTEGETLLFTSILGEIKETEICRYTSFHSLMRILNTKKASACSIVGMNDKSECYYYDSYMEKSYRADYAFRKIEDLNSNFIMSCSKISRLDKLTMWRMYGDNAKGVCLVYKLGQLGDRFILAPVSYAKEDKSHPQLDFIKELQDSYHISLTTIDVWKHFFKSYEYEDEKEIRLLYKDVDKKKYKWIQATGDILCPIVEFNIEKNNNEFPLILDKVYLGPKCMEKVVNKLQLSMFANNLNIEYNDDSIDILISKIDNYR